MMRRMSAFEALLCQVAVKRNAARGGDKPGQRDAAHAADAGDDEGFRQKLQRIWLRRAPSAFSMPISRVRYCTATSMMFMRPMPAMPSVSAPTSESSTCSAMDRMRNA